MSPVIPPRRGVLFHRGNMPPVGRLTASAVLIGAIVIILQRWKVLAATPHTVRSIMAAVVETLISAVGIGAVVTILILVQCWNRPDPSDPYR